jgi:hydroxybutyrate-dimer hydrolase
MHAKYVRNLGLLFSISALAACSSDGPKVNEIPAGVAKLTEKAYDGTTDDLLTGGLGKTGIAAAAAPAFANPAAPTAAELRRNAIYVNYRAVMDYTAAGGFGSLYGPNVDASGAATSGEGKIAGSEIIATLDDGTGAQNVTVMVQIPSNFDVNNACIIVGASSGSRGVYGAIGTAGEWGLRRGCAVAYTDKGSGNGIHDLMTDTVTLRDGTQASAATAGADAFFKANLSPAALTAFNTATPNRVAYKHAHSQQNPEKDWGKNTLAAARFAIYALNEKYGDPISGSTQKTRKFDAGNTLIIASSISNGAGAAIAAAEQDEEGLIDGVAVTEPNVFAGNNGALTIRQGAATVTNGGKHLLDYFTYANIYQPCAALSSNSGLSLNAAFWPVVFTTAAENRCFALAAKGLISGVDKAARADDALAKMNAYGWQSETNYLQQSHFRFATNSIVVTYLNTYGKFSVTDNVCGYSFANTSATGDVIAQVANTQKSLFATGNGVPPTGGVNVVYNDSVGGAKLDFLATSPSTSTADFGLDGALCARSLATGKDAITGAALTGTAKAQSDRVLAGVNETALTGNLRGKPVIVVSGRSDTLIPVNHASRAYVGKNATVEGANSKLRYIEVTNAQHFDTFIAFGALLGYDTRYVPLHPYFVRAMDAMYAHLKTGAALPASQVVRTTPRATAATPLALSNVPNFVATPTAADAISFSGGTLSVPQ